MQFPLASLVAFLRVIFTAPLRSRPGADSSLGGAIDSILSSGPAARNPFGSGSLPSFQGARSVLDNLVDSVGDILGVGLDVIL